MMFVGSWDPTSSPIPALKQQWFGLKQGLHIDSYVGIERVDGYKVELIRTDTNAWGTVIRTETKGLINSGLSILWV